MPCNRYALCGQARAALGAWQGVPTEAEGLTAGAATALSASRGVVTVTVCAQGVHRCVHGWRAELRFARNDVNCMAGYCICADNLTRHFHPVDTDDGNETDAHDYGFTVRGATTGAGAWCVAGGTATSDKPHTQRVGVTARGGGVERPPQRATGAGCSRAWGRRHHEKRRDAPSAAAPTWVGRRSLFFVSFNP